MVVMVSAPPHRGHPPFFVPLGQLWAWARQQGPPRIPPHFTLQVRRPQASQEAVGGFKFLCAAQGVSRRPAPCHRTLIPANRVSAGHSSQRPARTSGLLAANMTLNGDPDKEQSGCS